MSRQTEFVLRSIEERNVHFVRLWFADVLGSLKSVAIAPAEIESAFAEGVGFDGSSIEGYARVYESDMVAHPDPSTFQMLPWRQGTGTARMFCDIANPDGTPSWADPRSTPWVTRGLHVRPGWGRAHHEPGVVRDARPGTADRPRPHDFSADESTLWWPRGACHSPDHQR